MENNIQYEHTIGSLDQQIRIIKEYNDFYQDSQPGLDAAPKLPQATTRVSNIDCWFALFIMEIIIKKSN